MPEPTMEEKQINVKIKRFNPEKDKRPYWAEYKLKAQGHRPRVGRPQPDQVGN